MKITCDNCQQILEKYLCDIPSEWRSDIAKVICEAITQDYTLDCDGVEGCQTLTTLSAFSVSNNIASVTYKDEDGVSFTRMFDIAQILNNSISSVNPKCVAPADQWASWTYQRKLQAIIEYKCRCCEKATTTTTTTTSAPTTTSTTTTTTAYTTTTTSTSTTSTTTSAPVTTTTTTLAPVSTTTTTTYCGNVTNIVTTEVTSTSTTTTSVPATTTTTTSNLSSVIAVIGSTGLELSDYYVYAYVGVDNPVLVDTTFVVDVETQNLGTISVTTVIPSGFTNATGSSTTGPSNPGSAVSDCIVSCDNVNVTITGFTC